MGYEISAIRPADKIGNRMVDKLLEQEGIRRDGNLDYTCGVFDDDYDLVATGSCFGNTLRCMAVSSAHQGEGLMNLVVSHLTEFQAARGNLRLFLYTKYKSAKFFGDLGFYEIARVDGNLVFMENRRTGFSDYITSLQKTKAEGQKAAAIVMNANPFTLGHRHLVETAAKENDVVHLFVLSEEAGPIPFAVRKKLVQAGVADLPNVILHDSGPYIISAATFPSYFLKDQETVIRTHASLDLAVFGRIAGSLGITTRYVGEEPTSVVTNLYNTVMAERLPQMGIACHVIPRKEAEGRVISASTVRQAIHDDRLEEIRDFLPETTYAYFTSPEAAPVVAAIRREKNVIHY